MSTSTTTERPLDIPLDDDSFYEQENSPLAGAFRRFDDSNLTRYAFIAGDDIPVNDRAGGRFWGLFKDEVIRKRRLIPIRAARTLSIMELPALTGTAETVYAPGYLSNYEAQALAEGLEGRTNSMALMRPPRTVAYEIMGEYEATAYGPAIFEHAQLMGDDKRELIKKLYAAIVPRAVFADPAAPRPKAGVFTEVAGLGALLPVTRKGVTLLGLVTGTFLDQWRTYLNTYAAVNVQRANLSQRVPKGEVEGTDSPLSEHKLAMFMLERMQEACMRAWTHQTGYLESSRSQILGKRNGGKGKQWYDERDERYLLETGKVPLNLEEVAAASAMQERTESTMMAGFEKIVERMNPPVSATEIAAQVQAAVKEQVGDVLASLSAEQLEAILRNKRLAQETTAIPTVDTEERRIEGLRARKAAQRPTPEETTAEGSAETEFEGDLTEVITPLDDDGSAETTE